jgi:hydrogenase maturation factor
MCLGILGKVVSNYREHDLRMGKIDFSGISKRVCLDAFDFTPRENVGRSGLTN